MNIINPINGKGYNIYSNEGQNILKNYIQNYKLGGSGEIIGRRDTFDKPSLIPMPLKKFSLTDKPLLPPPVPKKNIMDVVKRNAHLRRLWETRYIALFKQLEDPEGPELNDMQLKFLNWYLGSIGIMGNDGRPLTRREYFLYLNNEYRKLALEERDERLLEKERRHFMETQDKEEEIQAALGEDFLNNGIKIPPSPKKRYFRPTFLDDTNEFDDDDDVPDSEETMFRMSAGAKKKQKK